MANVSIEGPITAFHTEGDAIDEVSATACADYLRRREGAERAAAKSSTTDVARRIHQELAQMYSSKRRGAANA